MAKHRADNDMNRYLNLRIVFSLSIAARRWLTSYLADALTLAAGELFFEVQFSLLSKTF
jgi:hypothetical protein